MDILLVYVEIGLKAAEVASTRQHHFVWLVRQQATAQYSIVVVWLKLFWKKILRIHEFLSWVPSLFSLQYRVWKYVWHFLIWQISFAHANVAVHKIELKALFL